MPPKRIILKSSSSASASSVESVTVLPDKSKRSTRTAREVPSKRQLPAARSVRATKKVAPPEPESSDESPDESTEAAEPGSDLSLSLSEAESNDDALSLTSVSGSETSPAKLTARQRTLLSGSLDSMPSTEHLLPRELTEEEQLRKSEKSRRRLMMRDQKLEQSKADTIQRLLQKQSSRSKKMRTQDTEVEKTDAKLDGIKPYGARSVITKDKNVLILGQSVPLIMQKPVDYPKPLLCSVKGCKNVKRYMHSHLKIPVCSIECYRESSK
ncbi:hypothetical protein PSACC_01021 [Paramicrosporidium saccamoebae]|uniref:INO80 complex subunit B-like conserved region domain-containing protein n=1 Tax=Paramicrosporidium saccamoebae TaxID=1246581 RepID=A0A2H9TN30_9FUNG|nr:hypothetical protein PSACC_01021 [Paramicrosporidium saccamoebae]